MRPLLALALLATTLPATAGRPTSDLSGTFTMYFENDMFAGTDRYYTNGAKLSWTSGDLEKFSDSGYASPLLPFIDRLPFVNSANFQKNLAFSLGQNMYTPDNTESSDVVKGDRPYAGWLYLGLGLIWKNADVKNSLIIDVGVVGPASYAQETQRLVHEARGIGSPRGWDHQLHNELGVVATYERTWRWPRRERRAGLNWEFLPHAGVALGNVYTYANIGGELRVGFNLPDDFGTSGIGPSSSTSTPVEGAQQAARARFDLGAYVFARVDGRAVAHNIFLDGNTFGDSVSVHRKPLVADLSVGAAVNYHNTKFTYALVYRTEEFAGQEDGQLFGAISMNFAF